MIKIPKWDIKAEGSVQTSEEMNSVVDAVIMNASELQIMKDTTYNKTEVDNIKRSITGDTTKTVDEVNDLQILVSEKLDKLIDDTKSDYKNAEIDQKDDAVKTAITATLDTKIETAIGEVVAKGSVESTKETKSGVLDIDGTKYDVYTKVIIMSGLPNKVNTPIEFTISNEPIGYNMYFSVESMSVYLASQKTVSNFLLNTHKIGRVYTKENASTVLTMSANEDTNDQYKATLVIKYVKFYGDALKIKITFPSGTNLDSIHPYIPNLKYNKKLLGSFTMDDSKPIWNCWHAVCNKKWVDDEKMSFFNPNDNRIFTAHQEWTEQGHSKTTGFIPPYELGYTSGTGFFRSFSANVAIIPSWTIGRDVESGVDVPWVGSKEMRYMKDFGSTISSHDLTDYNDNLSQLDFNKVCDNTYNFLNSLFDQRPKINQNPNGDMVMLSKSWGCPYMQYVMDATRGRGDDDNAGYYLFNKKDYDISDKSLKRITERNFSGIGGWNIMYWVDQIIAQNDVVANDRRWLILGSHGESGVYTYPALKKLCDTVGSKGTDIVWIPSIDELYEYVFIRDRSVLYTTKNAKDNSIDLHILAPKQDNFIFRDLTVMFDGVTSNNGVNMIESNNILGLSSGISDGKLMINIDFNNDLETKAAKYTTIAEQKKDDFSYYDAKYFIDQLKPSLGEPYKTRLNAIFGAPKLTKLILTYDNSYVNNDKLIVSLGYTGSRPSEMKVGKTGDMLNIWTTYADTFEYTLGSDFIVGVAKDISITAKVKNTFGESEEITKVLSITKSGLTVSDVSVEGGLNVTSNIITLKWKDNSKDVLATCQEGSGQITNLVVVPQNGSALPSGTTYRTAQFIISQSAGSKTLHLKVKDIPSNIESSDNVITVNYTITPLSITNILVDGKSEALPEVLVGNHLISLAYAGTPTNMYISETDYSSSTPVWETFAFNKSIAINGIGSQFDIDGYINKTIYAALKNDTTSTNQISKTIKAYKPLTVSNWGVISGADIASNIFNTTLTVAPGEKILKYKITGDITTPNSGYVDMANDVNYGKLTGTISDGLGSKSFVMELIGVLGTVVSMSRSINRIEAPVSGRKAIFGTVDAYDLPGNAVVAGLGNVNCGGRSSTKNFDVVDTAGVKFFTEVGKYYPYFGSKIDTYRTKYNYAIESGVPSIFWTGNALLTTDFAIPSAYDNILIKNGTEARVSVWGRNPTTTPETSRMCHLFESVPNGNYKVRLLCCGKLNNDEYKSYKYQIQNTTLSGTINPYLNNTLWYEQDVTVNDGTMFIGYYRDTPAGSDDNGGAAPIVAFEIIAL